jgi:hypothetical protein
VNKRDSGNKNMNKREVIRQVLASRFRTNDRMMRVDQEIDGECAGCDELETCFIVTSAVVGLDNEELLSGCMLPVMAETSRLSEG